MAKHTFYKFTGNLYFVLVEPCMSQPCKNGGSCYTGESSYTCVCGGDFTGTQCQEMGKSVVQKLRSRIHTNLWLGGEVYVHTQCQKMNKS